MRVPSRSTARHDGTRASWLRPTTICPPLPRPSVVHGRADRSAPRRRAPCARASRRRQSARETPHRAARRHRVSSATTSRSTRTASTPTPPRSSGGSSAAGYQAYLVGGCVRDLLLGGKPKDFDVATSARPEDVRALFRNCRIIGRRFRLAHILFGGGKVDRGRDVPAQPGDGSPRGRRTARRSTTSSSAATTSSATRTRTPSAATSPSTRSSTTSTGARCSTGAAGCRTSRRRTIHTIGDPIGALPRRPDPHPARRSSSRRGSTSASQPDVYDAMVATREELAKAARPRVFEEILRLLRGGAAHRSMWLLWETGAMAVLLPELAAFLDDEEAHRRRRARASFAKMDAIDAMTRARGTPLDDVVLWTLLLKEPLDEACAGARDRIARGDRVPRSHHRAHRRAPPHRRRRAPHRRHPAAAPVGRRPAASAGRSSCRRPSTCSRPSCSARARDRRRAEAPRCGRSHSAPRLHSPAARSTATSGVAAVEGPPTSLQHLL